MLVDPECVIQGRVIRPADVESIRSLLAENPGATRYKVSRLLCRLWDWRDPNGHVKDMAARSLLFKLSERGWITLPAKRRESPNRMRHKTVCWVDHDRDLVASSLAELIPLQVSVAAITDGAVCEVSEGIKCRHVGTGD